MTIEQQRGQLSLQYRAGEISWDTYSKGLLALKSVDRPAPVRPPIPKPASMSKPRAAPLDPQSAALLRAEVAKLMNKTAASGPEDLEAVSAQARAWAERKNRSEKR